jgi:uncharacterized protein
VSHERPNGVYGIPVAFAYEAENERAVLDLGFAPESKKREFIEATDEACLTTYEWSEPHDWRSVVMSGSFEGLADDEVDDETEAWFHAVAKDIEVEERSLELRWYELRATELSGRTSRH